MPAEVHRTAWWKDPQQLIRKLRMPLLPATSPLSLIAKAALCDIPERVPRFSIPVSGLQRKAVWFPFAAVEYPTTAPWALIPVATLWLPPSVPRSVISGGGGGGLAAGRCANGVP